MFVDRNVGRLVEPLSGRSLEPAEIVDRCLARMAVYADRGLEPGDRVFLHNGNTLEFFVELLSVWNLGGTAIPIDGRLTPFEVETLAGAAKPRFCVWNEAPDGAITKALASLGVGVLDATEKPPGSIKSLKPRGASFTLDDDALILFTSGTTGQPKGVVHTHRSLRARWVTLRQSLGIERYRRTLCLLPTHFGHGLICNCLFPWLSGQDLFILPPFRGDILMGLGGILDKHEISFMSSVPSVWRLALKTAKPPTSGRLERVFCGSAPLSASLWKSIQEWCGTREVWNSYGITETGSWLAGTSIGDFEPADGLVGEAWGGVVRVLKTRDPDITPPLAEVCAPGESGYVWVNTPGLMKGYLEREDLTREVVSQGWFLTGDIGQVDDRGHLYLRGREREEINKGGMKVYPGDIDSVIERFKGIVDVSSFGFEDALHGENIGVALVVESADDDSLYALHEWTNEHLANHQMPQRWYVLDEIPRTSRGKINRENVAATCAGLEQVNMRGLVRARRSSSGGGQKE